MLEQHHAVVTSAQPLGVRTRAMASASLRTSAMSERSAQFDTLRRSNEESNAFVRTCIEEALVQLMGSKPFDRITVTDIARRAGVSRNAYYRNYPSKEAILAGCLDDVVEDISGALSRFDATTQAQEAWEALLAATHDFAPRYRLLLKAGYGSLIRERVRDASCMPRTGSDLANRYVAAYWAGAICSVLEDWVRADEDMPAEELTTLGAALMR